MLIYISICAIQTQLAVEKHLQKTNLQVIRQCFHHRTRDKHAEPRVLVQHIKEIIPLRHYFWIRRMDPQLPFKCELLDTVDEIGPPQCGILFEQTRPRGCSCGIWLGFEGLW